MTKLLITLSLFLFQFYGFSQTVIFEDDFDSYTVNNGLAYQSQNWETWSDPDGGNSEDAKLIDLESYSTPLSALFYDGIDIVHKFGAKTQGRYQVSFNMFIRAGAYFNLEHDFKDVYALSIWFNDSNDIWFNNGTDSLKLGVFTHDVWHNIMLDIDLGKDSISVFYDSVQLGQFVFSHSLDGESPSITLDVINFYGVSNTAPQFNIERSNFLLDDFKYIAIEPTSNQEAEINLESVYPNPTSGYVNIDLGDLDPEVKLVLRNVTGKVVFEQEYSGNKEIRFEIEGPSGIYFLELQYSETKSKFIKLVKK